MNRPHLFVRSFEMADKPSVVKKRGRGLLLLQLLAYGPRLLRLPNQAKGQHFVIGERTGYEVGHAQSMKKTGRDP